MAEDVGVSDGDLTMDIYTPTSGQASYPVLMIFHGGGWLINDKSIMDQMAQYIVTNGDYVVCNVDYRLLGDQDNSVTLDQIVMMYLVPWCGRRKILANTKATPSDLL